MRIHRLRHQREFALDARLALGAVPDDDDLRLAGQELLDAIEFGARALEVDRQLALLAGVAAADRGDRRHAERQHDDERRQKHGRRLEIHQMKAARPRRGREENHRQRRRENADVAIGS